MYIYYNENPQNKNVGDCTARAIGKAMGKTWKQIYVELCAQGLSMADYPDSNAVWGAYLMENGFTRQIMPQTCPYCYTIGDFADEHKKGTYVLATGTHVVCVKDGDIYDSFDSSDYAVMYYFEKVE